MKGQTKEYVFKPAPELARVPGPARIEAGLLRAYSELIDWRPGSELLINGTYRLESFLGRGGFGLVFAVRELQSGRRLALKFINPAQLLQEKQQRRIQREFEVARKLDHSGLVRLHDLQAWRGVQFLVMDLVPGRTLAELVEQEGPQSWPSLAPLFQQILEILALVHERGMVHRDIKPANIMITPEGRVVLLDLGLTRELNDPMKTASSGELVGSPHYLPPEILRGHSHSQASDLYQLALVVHFALSGRRPFAGENASESTMEILNRQLSRPLDLPRVPGLPGRIRNVLSLCLAKNPQQRPPNAGRLTALLRRPILLWLRQLVLRFTEKGRSLAVLLAGLLVLLSLGLYLLLPVSGIRRDGPDLLGVNALGRELWRRGPEAGERLFYWQAGRDENGRPQAAALYIPAEERLVFRLEEARPELLSFRRCVWDARGRRHHELNLSHLRKRFHGYYPLSVPDGKNISGIRPNGWQVLLLEQISGMFPSELHVWDGMAEQSLYWLSSPGQVVHLEFLGNGPDNSELILLTHNNPFCNYMNWHWNLRPGYHLFAPLSAFSNLIITTKTKNSQLFFLPQYARLTENDWGQQGCAEFFSGVSKSQVRVERSGRVSYSSGTESFSFQEDFEANSRAIQELDLAYRQLMQKNGEKAGSILARLDESSVRNPWLLSTIAYFRAQAAALNGDLTAADDLLGLALEHDPHNLDAANRRLELLLLAEGPAAVLHLLDLSPQQNDFFWGMSSGLSLFRFCIKLMLTDFESASPLFERISSHTTDYRDERQISLQALAQLFQQNDSALEPLIRKMAEPLKYNSVLFDISEMQLMLARLLVIDGQYARAEPLLSFHVIQDEVQRDFAELSLAWIEAETGRIKTALRRAEPAFAKQNKLARALFWPRFWLFYDAYAYGRVMESAGRADQAREGYLLCLELAPRSFLAADAGRRLAEL